MNSYLEYYEFISFEYEDFVSLNMMNIYFVEDHVFTSSEQILHRLNLSNSTSFESIKFYIVWIYQILHRLNLNFFTSFYCIKFSTVCIFYCMSYGFLSQSYEFNHPIYNSNLFWILCFDYSNLTKWLCRTECNHSMLHWKLLIYTMFPWPRIRYTLTSSLFSSFMSVSTLCPPKSGTELQVYALHPQLKRVFLFIHSIPSFHRAVKAFYSRAVRRGRRRERLLRTARRRGWRRRERRFRCHRSCPRRRGQPLHGNVHGARERCFEERERGAPATTRGEADVGRTR